ncbi:MAG: helix-turn-helix domain-containing protein [Alphaproteobacteria bacterium]|nr:helix-turn-helix domain-containing protein [Alphaproteobacteria bacterium]
MEHILLSPRRDISYDEINSLRKIASELVEKTEELRGFGRELEKKIQDVNFLKKSYHAGAEVATEIALGTPEFEAIAIVAKRNCFYRQSLAEVWYTRKQKKKYINLYAKRYMALKMSKAGFSTRDIAKAIGCTVGTVYRYKKDCANSKTMNEMINYF